MLSTGLSADLIPMKILRLFNNWGNVLVKMLMVNISIRNVYGKIECNSFFFLLNKDSLVY